MARKDKTGGWYGDSRRHADAAHRRNENWFQTQFRRLRWKIGDFIRWITP